MSLWKIAWRSIQQRSLASTLTAISMALGVTLVVAVMVVGHAVENYFQTGTGLGYNLVVGKKGSSLQLVMNTVYYLDRPIENIPWEFYKEFLPATARSDKKAGKFSPWIDKAVPVNMGDFYDEFLVVGTTAEMFDGLELTPGQKFAFTAGENFSDDDFFSGVIGSDVARKTGLRVGDTFQPTHSAPVDGHVHEEKFTVKGILERTGTPIDRAIYVNIEGHLLLRGHAREADVPHPGLGEPSVTQGHDKDAGQTHKHEEKGTEKHEHDEVAEKKHEHGDKAAENHDQQHIAHEQDQKHDAQHKHNEKDVHDHAHEKPTVADSTVKHVHEDHDHDAHARQGDAHNHEHDHDHAHGHDHGHSHDHAHHHDPLPESQREVTAILVLTKSLGGLPPELTMPSVQTPINEGVVAQAVQPIRVITQFLTTFLGPLRLVLLGLTVLIVVVSAISILVSIYNSMAERRHEIAVMRALGAGRATVMQIMLLESVLLALLGGLLGWFVGHGILGALSPWLTNWTGVTFTAFHFTGAELYLIPGIIALASLVGFLPAWSAYRTDVAKALTANP
jgi:ABC-type lipoprotein release transport system permease subunit